MSNLSTGLSSKEARQQLKKAGPNELPHSGRRTCWHIVRNIIKEPMVLMLLGAGGIYLILGDWREAILLISLGSASVFITIIQEARSERVLDTLRDLTSPRALVIRDGRKQRIAGRDVVLGDILVLGEGDRVAADAIIRSENSLEADESLLTGEALPVQKSASMGQPKPAALGGNNAPFVYSGTLIVRGHGIAEVIATGAHSEIGQIGVALKSIQSEAPRLAQQTGNLVRIFSLVGFAISVVFTVTYGLIRGAWLDALLSGIALSMSFLPEEFPLVLAVFLVMGSWRIARAGVLTRRAAAIESLGSATVLCTDKTGTLTENRMTIVQIQMENGDIFDIRDESSWLADNAVKHVIDIGRYASQPDPFDPMEKAFHQLALRIEDQGKSEAIDLVRDYPFGDEILAMSNVWQQGKGNLFVASKGAPEAIMELCRLDSDRRTALRLKIDQMAVQGMRVLAIAEATYGLESLPELQSDFCFNFLGLVGFVDPLRSTVQDAVRECKTAGIRVVMITGDYSVTAQAIAAEAGIRSDKVLSGGDIENMTPQYLAECVRDVDIFARIKPAQKLQIVRALQNNGEIVAMTGDGVNDAPALKAAQIGIAMGQRGTDVAREASSIVLLNDDFGSIVTTIRLGRRIYDNLHKAIGFVLAAHIPIAGLAIFPLLFGLPLILMPAHIAFLEIVVDPVCSIAFEAEPEESDLMTRPPRDPKAPLLSRSLILWSVIQGSVILFSLGTILIMTIWREMSPDTMRSLAFIMLVLGDIVLILINRSFATSPLQALVKPNPVLWWVLAFDACLLALILAPTPTRQLFRFGIVSPQNIVICVLVSVVALFVIEFMKRFWQDALRR
ncbi:cation-translocating P-type ATPase [Zymomonas mobilis]|uniref:cation-translocating P-type ATPase n=1 Tax=Zymomonas mobilis TaxID=542 RepID=UPI00130E6CA9|nr:cation-translocating P-type ATPase [Zymomonas mobilis]MDX5949560.1 cation-translocating P-type ATPase [Zymomonas mobilis subsp. pomaceae]